jgi:hypothetical protein
VRGMRRTEGGCSLLPPTKDAMSATLTAETRSALDPPPAITRWAPAAAERSLYAAGVSALALHLVDTALRGSATSLAGIAVLLALAGLAIVVHPRLARRTRVAWSGVLGLMTAGAVGSSDGLRFLGAGPAWTELAGVVAAFGGLALVAAHDRRRPARTPARASAAPSSRT